ncbi:MAG: hypothetical protein MJ252_19040, partial [archaeon]|nr:hypothetical protein [archaeon]
MKSKYYSSLYFLILNSFLLNEVFSSEDTCTELKNCFTCFAKKCIWTDSKCNDVSGERTDLNVNIIYDKCKQYSSFDITYYCGDSLIKDGETKEMPEILGTKEGGYGKEDVVCKYTYTLGDKKETTVKILTHYPLKVEIFMRVIFNDESQKEFIIHASDYTGEFSKVNLVDIYFKTTQRFDNNPISITIESEGKIYNSSLLITIIILVILFLFCGTSFCIYKRRLKNLRELRNEREQIYLNNIGFTQQDIFDENNTNNENHHRERMSDKEIKKIRKEQLLKELNGQLASKEFTKEIGKFNMNCSICLEDFKRSSIVSVTSCQHVFHSKCLKKWLKEKLLDPKCPNCNCHILPSVHEDATKRTIANNNQEEGVELSNINNNRNERNSGLNLHHMEESSILPFASSSRILNNRSRIEINSNLDNSEIENNERDINPSPNSIGSQNMLSNSNKEVNISTLNREEENKKESN